MLLKVFPQGAHCKTNNHVSRYRLTLMHITCTQFNMHVPLSHGWWNRKNLFVSFFLSYNLFFEKRLKLQYL